MFAVDVERVGSVPTERLEAELCGHASRSAAAMYRWLVLVAEFDRREAAGPWGVRSTAAWLAWQCGLDSRTARDHVRVARSLVRLPLIAESFATGQLPYSKVRALTRVATPATEADLLSYALAATTSQLELTVRRFRQYVPDPDTREPSAESTASAGWDDDASGRLVASLRTEDAAVVFAALDAEVDRMAAELRESGSAEPLSKLRARALVEWAERSLDAATEAAGDDRYLVVVHATVDQHAARVEDGPPLDAATLARLLCDQPVAPLIKDSDGNPLFLGRTTKTVSRAMRRAIKARDGDTCRFPGCRSRRRLHGHHVRWWQRDLGPTDVVNLILLCPYHHSRVHKGEFTVTADGIGRFAFHRADGTPLDPAPRLPVADEPLLPHATAPIAGGHGERLDLDHALTALGTLFTRPG